MKGELLGYLEMEKIQTKITLGFYFVLFRIWPIFNLACKDIFFWMVQVHPMPLRYIQKNKPGRIMLGHRPGIFHRKRFFLKKTRVASPFTQSGGSCSSTSRNLTWSIWLFYSPYFYPWFQLWELFIRRQVVMIFY